MIASLPDPYGLLDAWRRGDAQSAWPLADWCEEAGNPEGLPLAGFREMAAAGKVPFEGPSLEVFPDEYEWERPPLRSRRRVVWTWLLGDADPWGLAEPVVDGFVVRQHRWEVEGSYEPEDLENPSELDWRYFLDEGLVRAYGEPSSVVVSRVRRIVEVSDFALAVVVAGLGYEVAAGLRIKPNEGGLPPGG